MKKIYAVAALFIAGCSVVTVLTACNKNDISASSTSGTTEKSVEFSTDVDGTAYSQGDDGYKYVITTASEETTINNIVSGHSYTHPAPVEQTTKENKTKSTPYGVLFLFGDPSGIRTPDTLIKSQVLCQLS